MGGERTPLSRTFDSPFPFIMSETASMFSKLNIKSHSNNLYWFSVIKKILHYLVRWLTFKDMNILKIPPPHTNFQPEILSELRTTLCLNHCFSRIKTNNRSNLLSTWCHEVSKDFLTEGLAAPGDTVLCLLLEGVGIPPPWIPSNITDAH